MNSSSVQKEGVLAKNTLINIVGKCIPLLFAVASLPYVIDGLGTDRFGVLTLVWMVIGYFGLFDMGLGRATTKFVADQEAKDAGHLSPVISTSILLLVLFGVIGGALIFLVTPFLVEDILNIPIELIPETTTSFYILSGSIPVVLGSIGARGVLEAQQRFSLVNTVKIPATIINYVGPLLVLPFTNKLQYVVLLLVIERTLSFIIFTYFSFRGRSFFSYREDSFTKWAKKLLGFGAWLTVSNFISPIMAYMDRFIIGAMLSMTAVAYYTTPFEVVSRLLIISGGFMGVMFPAFSVYSLENKKKLGSLYQKSIRYLFVVLSPVVILLIFAARPLLYFWLGNEFSQHSTVILQVLAMGILVNSVAMVPSTVIQAVGRPDIRAKLHMVELPVYLALIWYLTYTLGILGAALAWFIRVSVDCGLLLIFSNRLGAVFNTDWSKLLVKMSMLVGFILIGAILLHYINNNFFVITFAVGSGLIALFSSWKYLLKKSEQDQVKNLILEFRMKKNI